jgi:hypothetical protein
MGVTARRSTMAALAAVTALVLFAGVAGAVSSGGYDPRKQGYDPDRPASEQRCPVDSDSSAKADAPDPRCHNFVIGVDDSSDPTTYHRFVQAGTLQQADQDNVHGADYRVDSNGDGSGVVVTGSADTNWQPFTKDSCDEFSLVLYPVELLLYATGQGNEPCPIEPTGPPTSPTVGAPEVRTGDPRADGLTALLTSGTNLYIGSDDNLNTGEHDGADGQYGTQHAQNGASDGGAINVDWHPSTATPTAYDPFPSAAAGGGACTDGTCISVQSARRDVYNGDTEGGRPVYDYEGKHWDPAGCDSGGAQAEQRCDDPSTAQQEDMDSYRREERQHVYANPGVQFYEDPDPQGSPLGGPEMYPAPAVYAGTCGVLVGGGAVSAPGGNDVGQTRVTTAC